MNEIGMKIRAARKQAGKSQKELGKTLGVSEALICQYETGKRIPKMETIKKIADGIGITPFELVGVEWADMQLGDEGLDQLRTDVKASELLDQFSGLNDLGQAKALEYVSDLTEQPKYKK